MESWLEGKIVVESIRDKSSLEMQKLFKETLRELHEEQTADGSQCSGSKKLEPEHWDPSATDSLCQATPEPETTSEVSCLNWLLNSLFLDLINFCISFGNGSLRRTGKPQKLHETQWEFYQVQSQNISFHTLEAWGRCLGRWFPFFHTCSPLAQTPEPNNWLEIFHFKCN